MDRSRQRSVGPDRRCPGVDLIRTDTTTTVNERSGNLLLAGLLNLGRGGRQVPRNVASPIQNVTSTRSVGLSPTSNNVGGEGDLSLPADRLDGLTRKKCYLAEVVVEGLAVSTDT